MPEKARKNIKYKTTPRFGILPEIQAVGKTITNPPKTKTNKQTKKASGKS